MISKPTFIRDLPPPDQRHIAVWIRDIGNRHPFAQMPHDNLRRTRRRRVMTEAKAKLPHDDGHFPTPTKSKIWTLWPV